MSDEQTIPKSRFDERVKQARDTEAALREQIAQLTESNKALEKQASKSGSLAQQVEKLTADLANAGKSHGRQMAATLAGITDPEDVADVLAVYERRAPEGVEFADWLKGDNLPRSVQSLIPQPESAQPQPESSHAIPAESVLMPSGQAPNVTASLPRPNNGVVNRRATTALPTVNDIYRGSSDTDAHAANRIAMGLPATNPHASPRRWP
tara:strand:- start:189 stop:815 length:627 start_codon:yes stop_codon:yes gene_type:complete